MQIEVVINYIFPTWPTERSRHLLSNLPRIEDSISYQYWDCPIYKINWDLQLNLVEIYVDCSEVEDDVNYSTIN